VLVKKMFAEREECRQYASVRNFFQQRIFATFNRAANSR